MGSTFSTGDELRSLISASGSTVALTASACISWDSSSNSLTALGSSVMKTSWGGVRSSGSGVTGSVLTALARVVVVLRRRPSFGCRFREDCSSRYGNTEAIAPDLLRYMHYVRDRSACAFARVDLTTDNGLPAGVTRSESQSKAARSFSCRSRLQGHRREWTRWCWRIRSSRSCEHGRPQARALRTLEHGGCGHGAHEEGALRGSPRRRNRRSIQHVRGRSATGALSSPPVPIDGTGGPTPWIRPLPAIKFLVASTLATSYHEPD